MAILRSRWCRFRFPGRFQSSVFTVLLPAADPAFAIESTTSTSVSSRLLNSMYTHSQRQLFRNIWWRWCIIEPTRSILNCCLPQSRYFFHRRLLPFLPFFFFFDFFSLPPRFRRCVLLFRLFYLPWKEQYVGARAIRHRIDHNLRLLLLFPITTSARCGSTVAGVKRASRARRSLFNCVSIGIDANSECAL